MYPEHYSYIPVVSDPMLRDPQQEEEKKKKNQATRHETDETWLPLDYLRDNNTDQRRCLGK
jgi:hypothetical protein